MIIKVCGITASTQYNWLAQHSIEMIGLNFYAKSKRFISQPLEGINSPSNTKKVGVFVNPELSYLLEKVDEYNLDMVQLHGNESVAFCEEVAVRIAIIKVFGIDEKFSFVYIDGDLYQTTKDSLEFFYSRMVSGGIMMFDDWQWKLCPGVERAVNEFLEDKNEVVIKTTAYQAMIIKY